MKQKTINSFSKVTNNKRKITFDLILYNFDQKNKCLLNFIIQIIQYMNIEQYLL